MAQGLAAPRPLSDSGDRHHAATTRRGGSTGGRGFRRSTAATRRATLYLATRPAPAASAIARLAQLPLAARQAFERRYATVEITDSVAMMGGHQVALVRGYHGRLQQAVQELEGTS